MADIAAHYWHRGNDTNLIAVESMWFSRAVTFDHEDQACHRDGRAFCADLLSLFTTLGDSYR